MNETCDWPFDDSADTSVLTTERIMRGDYPILLVVHEDESEGGEWQFLDGLDLTATDFPKVGLQTIVSRDAAVLDLADLPCGWYAERTNVHAVWIRAKMPPLNESEDEQ